MSRKSLVAGYLVLLFFLHQDSWLKNDPTLVFGFLPATLAYHMAYTVAAAFGWWLVVKFAWPEELEGEADAVEATSPDQGGDL